MHKPPTTFSRSFKLGLLPIAATMALLAGLLVYVFARPVPPELIHSALTLLGSDAQSSPLVSLPFAYQLPSFFHMLALLLMTAAITHNQSHRLRVVALTTTFALGIIMELVQHPVVTNTLSACTATPCSWLQELEAYARTGTFDPLDLYAIAFSALVALIIITCIPSGLKHDLHDKDLNS